MRPTASKLPLAARCAWWARPDVALPAREAPSVHALLGTALHASAAGEEVAPDDKVDAIDLADLVAVYEAWWAEYSGGRVWSQELPLAYDPRTGAARVLPSQGSRDYSSAADHEVIGTCDAVGERCGVGPVEVLDLKTGRGAKRLAGYREQLEHAALCVAAIARVSEMRMTVAHVTARGVFVDSEQLDAIDLADARARLAALVESVPTAAPRPGPHCREMFCPAIAVCPETQAALATVPDARRLPLVGEVESDADAFALLDALPRFEAWMKERRSAVRARVLARGAIAASDGRVGQIVRSERETLRLDVPGAVDALRIVLGDDAAEEAIAKRTSKAAVRRAAKSTGGNAAKAERDVVSALRAIGAVKVSQYDELAITPAGALSEQGSEQ